MSRDTGKKSFLDFFRNSDIDDEDDEFDDDLFDDDDDEDEDDYPKRSKSNVGSSKLNSGNTRAFPDRSSRSTSQDSSYNVRPQTRNGTGSGKLVEFNGRKGIKSNMNGEVYVMQPRDVEDSDLIVDNLLDGYVVIINLEGVELNTAQRIVDFVGGAAKAINGSIVAINGNIFVATAYKDSVKGNIREDMAGGIHSSQVDYNF